MAVVEPPRTRSRRRTRSLNQAPPLVGYNVFEQDRPLVEALEREGGGWAADRARAVGELAGGEAIEWGRQANENPPVLRTHDRYGNRIDEVEFHPAWHRLMDVAVSHGAALAALDASRGPARTSRAPRCSCCWARPRPATAARSR